MFILVTMTTNAPTKTERTAQPQLLLVSNADAETAPSNSRWTLDAETRETGRRGLAKARAALRATRPPHLDIAA